jgi:CubicO group peptidase (beta-lactamase class C family)
MTSSSFEWDETIKPRTAIAYDNGNRNVPNFIFTEKAAAGLYTTAGDLARFAAAFMPGPNSAPVGRGILSPATVTMMMTAMPGAPGGSWDPNGQLGEPGLGAFTFMYQGHTFVTHTGVNTGWRAVYIVDRTSSEGLVVLTNGERGGESNAQTQSMWLEWVSAL